MEQLRSLLPQSTPELVFGLVLGWLALIEGSLWRRDRRAASGWFVAGFSMAAAAIAAGRVFPDPVFLCGAYAIRMCFSAGTARPAGGRHFAFVAVVWWPLLPLAIWAIGGAVPGRSALLLPILYADLVSIAGGWRRARGAARGDVAALAVAALLAWIAVGRGLVHGDRATELLHDYLRFWALAFGVSMLGVDRMRIDRALREAQAAARRMTGFYTALSDANQAMLRVREPEALYREICRISVETGQALMACVYTSDGRQIWRSASAGPAERILFKIPNPLDLTEKSVRDSITARVLTTGQFIVSNDYQSETNSQEWREQAVQQGVRSIAWFPFRRHAEVVGLLMLAGGEKNYFDDDLVKLLNELTGNVSFALERIAADLAQMEYERQIREGFERFSKLFHAAPVPAAIVSAHERRIVDVNEAMCARYQLERQDIVGRTTLSLDLKLVPEDREQFYEALMRQGHVRNLVTRSVDGAGMHRLELMNAERIDFQGSLCYLVISLDITDLRTLEEARAAAAAAESANRAKTQFLSRFSHELRTPLNAILGFSALLRSDAPDRLTQRQRLQIDLVQKAGWHLLSLTNDLLDLSRIEAGQRLIDLQPVKLAPILSDAVRMVSSLAGDIGVEIVEAFRDDRELAVAGDATRLRQVILNVLTNAIKYNKPDGTVSIRLESDASQVWIEIADTGIGMTPDQCRHLFEPFNRLGRESLSIEGTGVGLTLSRELVHLMKGEIRIESVVDLGTQVRIVFPAIRLPAFAPRQPDKPETEEEPNGLVLYIEDNEVNVLLVEQILSRWKSVEFVPARNGESGIALSRSLSPSLVLLDVQLPDMSGMDVLSRIRVESNRTDLPVVVLSADAMPEDVQAARALGATDYWTKPIDMARFASDVARILCRQTDRSNVD